MTRACDCFACGLVPFGLTDASSVSVLYVFPFISCFSVFGRRTSADFYSCNELFLLDVRASCLGFGLYLVHIHVSGVLCGGITHLVPEYSPLFLCSISFLYIQG